MARLRIKTCDEFEDALRAVPFARSRLDRFDIVVRKDSLLSYSLWKVLLDFVHDAIDCADWRAVQSLLALYEGVARVGKRSEMYEACYVSFLEDLRLPQDRAVLRELWRHAPVSFIRDIKFDRGL